MVYGAPIIRVAQVLFAALGILFTTLAVGRSRRRGYPVMSFESPR